MKQNGFTIIELILYITLLTLFLAGGIPFLWNMINLKGKTDIRQTLVSEVHLAFMRIEKEIEMASAVTDVGINSISYTDDSGLVTVDLQSGQLIRTHSVTGRTKLTSNLISIDTFTTVASTDPNKFDFSVTIAATMPPSSITSKYTESITQTAVIGNLKAQNQARNFMIDTTNAAVTNDDTRISDIILENITTTSITLKEITLEWSGVDATLLTKIQFGLSTLEFIGECPSPCTVDIPDQTILPQSTIGLSYFAFDDIISGTVFTITFTMLDDSEAILDYDTTYLLANAPTNERFTIQAKAQAISILPKL